MDSDEFIRFHGGPKDGEALILPLRKTPVRADQLDDVLLPHYIELRGGRYELNREMKRYEWCGPAAQH
ncbi:MAG TPA: hypothetical protein VGM50_23065 [Gemmatimonadaceae bacterium]|jgi:hypothetical protein